jgi:hypothetical protein
LLDDGSLTTLINNLTAAIQQTAAAGAWSTGDVKLTMKVVPDATWLMCNDQTIGDASSGAAYANANALNLYTLIWTNVSQAFAPVTGGRGASAAADWAAHKPMQLTLMMGRALAISGAGFGLTNRVLGTNLGEEMHVLTIAEMPSHNHLTNIQKNNGGGGGDFSTGLAGTVTSYPSNFAGGGGAHNNMPPESFLNAMSKL